MTPTELIDHASRDHAEISGLVSRLRAALGGGDRSVVEGLLGDLLLVEMRHYAVEEALMRAVAYGQAEAHRAEHAAMLETLTRIVEALVLGDVPSISAQILVHLESAIAHMIVSDKQLNGFVCASTSGRA